jgi:hypothetical protein
MYEDIPKTNTDIKHVTLPIPIIIKQYNLNNSSFDPTQNSPPSLWKMRLNKRIGDSPIRNVESSGLKI